MKAALILLALCGAAALSACGVDGPPIRPSLNTGVSVGASGVRPYTNVNVGIGQHVNVGVGL